MVKKNPLYKIILTDLVGIFILILVPILGPLPGPGGIPLTISGFSLLAINHVWAQKILWYVKTHSESLSKLLFPNKKWAKWSWDLFALLLMIVGIWMSFVAEWWLLRGLSIGIMASSTTFFMLNRDRIAWLESRIRRGK